MTDKLAAYLGPEPRKLTVGKSFEKKSGSRYHGLRYDFKPVSIDEDKDGVLEVKENSSVAVSLPHIDGSGQTNYKGHLSNASTKECILIIDHETGELTLERLSHQIMVKKTRAERAEKSDKSDSERFPQPKPELERSNPYEVKKIPDKPNIPYSRHEAAPRSRKPSTSRETDSEFCITPMNSAKSSPARPGSAKPSPLRQGSTKSSPSLSQIDTLGRPLDSLGRPLDSSSSSSSDSSDSDSDFEEAKRSGVENTGLSLMSQDFSSEPVLPKRGGVLPSARPEPKHRKSAAQDSSSSKSSHPFQPKTDILGDDLRLSDSDNSD